MWLVSGWPPKFYLLAENRLIVVSAFILGAALFGLSAVFSFRKAQTTVHPMHPEQASTLVTAGVFQWSRNPMYVGLLLGLLAWALFLSSLWAMVCAIVFAVYMTRFQIIPEERAMLELFGSAFTEYCQSTRRWL